MSLNSGDWRARNEPGRRGRTPPLVTRRMLRQEAWVSLQRGRYLPRMARPPLRCGAGKAVMIDARRRGVLPGVLAPRLENLGTALQQVGPLIRLNDPALRDVGETGLRDLRRNPRLGHP